MRAPNSLLLPCDRSRAHTNTRFSLLSRSSFLIFMLILFYLFMKEKTEEMNPSFNLSSGTPLIFDLLKTINPKSRKKKLNIYTESLY